MSLGARREHELDGQPGRRFARTRRDEALTLLVHSSPKRGDLPIGGLSINRMDRPPNQL